MYDIIIKNGCIFDGSGNPWFYSDIGIKDGEIVAIRRLNNENAGQVIDACGLAVSPGFIDIHCHSDALLFANKRECAKVLQGVTTEVIGNCGISATPASSAHLELLKKYTSSIFANIEMPWDWQTTGEFLTRIETQKTITNIAALVGHGTVRIAVMGFDNRTPTDKELNAMKELVEEALTNGAFGLSSGLIYAPGMYCKTDELVEICKVVAANGGYYATHMRNEADHVIEGVKEALTIGEESGVAVQISHHKIAGKINWGKCHETLQLAEEAREKGVDVTCDAYPYLAGSTMLATTLPPWMHEGGVEKLLTRLAEPENRARIKKEIATGLNGWPNIVKVCGWENILIASCRTQKNKVYEGKNLKEIAKIRKIEPEDALFDLLLEEKADILMVDFMMCEEDVSYILKHPLVMMGSDAIPSTGKPHPRFFGAFPRFLRKYVLDEKNMTLAEGIRKITSMPAQRLGLTDRGMLKEGMYADITIFDPQSIKDNATFMNPQQYASGIKYVLINGKIAVSDGTYTGSLEGKVLRKKR